jgi:alpha-L-fucosidase
MKNQLQELLTQYGPICELWFDGFWKKQKSGWKKESKIGEAAANSENKDKSQFSAPEDFINSWRSEGAFRWQMDHLYQFVKKNQPDCLVANNATTAFPGVPLHPVDFRCGEKATEQKSDQKVWKWLGDDVFLPLQIETTMSQKGKKGDFESGSWFWHDWDHSVASKEQILLWLSKSKELNANFLLNCGPMANGKLRPEDEKVLTSLN